MNQSKKIITYINEKGGIGKTSACFNVAWHMAEKKKVLMIDLDGQRANLTFFCGIKKDDDLPTMYDVVCGNKDIKDVIVNVKENLDIVPATSNVINITSQAKITRMKKALESIKDEYYMIFIDVNPTPGWLHVLALSCADHVIIPMLPDVATLEANKGVIESIQEIKETTNPTLNVLGLLINQNTDGSNMSKGSKQIANIIADKLNTIVFETKIRRAVVLGECVGEHKGITEYKPKCDAANDIIALTKEIERRLSKYEW